MFLQGDVETSQICWYLPHIPMNSRKQEVISRTGKFSFSSLHVYIMYQKPENGRTEVFTILYIRFYQNLLSLFEQTRLYLTLLAFMGNHTSLYKASLLAGHLRLYSQNHNYLWNNGGHSLMITRINAYKK